MKQVIFIFLLLFFGLSKINAQPSTQLNSAEILLALQKLNTVGSVLYVAAHPDDENTQLLAYMSSENKLRTGYLALTRGDGGQNLIGKEQGDMLGLIRTQELLAARRVDGAEQFFTRANDFGFSKNPEETFSIWNKDSLLGDVVWAIRRFKPDVIICRFPTTGEGGHGHHTASAILAEEAFTAAADPKRFPQQLAYTEVWQAKRLFWNTFNFGEKNTTSPGQIKIDAGVYNPILGKGYGEIAALSRSNHKSQGFGSAMERGSSIEFFKQLKGDTVKSDLFEGINLTWLRFNSTASIQKSIGKCIDKFDPAYPEKILPYLIIVYKQLQQLDESNSEIKYWKQQKLKEAESIILSCSGLWMEACAADYSAVPGNKIAMTAQIIRRNNCNVKLTALNFFNQKDTICNTLLKQNEMVSFHHQELLAASTPYSNPYWLNEKHDVSFFKIKDQLLVGLPENPSSANVIFSLEIEGMPIQIKRPLIYKSTDPVKGEVYRPFEILPPATINISEKVIVFSDANPKTIHCTVKANTDNIKGVLQIIVPNGWMISIKNPEYNLAAKNDEAIIDVTLTPAKNNGADMLTASLKINNEYYTKSIQRVEFNHIPYQFILSNAEAKLVNVDLKFGGLNIGYIPGAGDNVANCLKQIGYQVTILTDELLANENLSQFNAIITGVRAYNINPKLQLNYNKLMEYISNGGNLIVQYNTNNSIGKEKAKIGPYPFNISNVRVTDEHAEVRIINPNHQAVVSPNLISNKDFDGWIQERGIYFATEIDSNYETVFSMNDRNEKPSEGSLIIAKYGKGNFVYTGLDFFRELPAGVTGAYRLFVNLISLPVTK